MLSWWFFLWSCLSWSGGLGIGWCPIPNPTSKTPRTPPTPKPMGWTPRKPLGEAKERSPHLTPKKSRQSKRTAEKKEAEMTPEGWTHTQRVNSLRATCTTSNPPIMTFPKKAPVLPSKVNKRWPATIFAINRTARVPGRIMLLTVSMQTIKGIKTRGVPWGTRCAKTCAHI